MTGQYQLLPDLTPEEYESLKADIAERGVKVPVEYDEQGNILDGHHRVRACKELGIQHWDRIVRKAMTEQEKRQHVRALNLLRRHLNQEQQRQVIASQLKDTPELSDSLTGQQLGVDHKTVASVRAELESTWEIPKLNTRIGKDGKARPSRKPRRSYVSQETAEKAEKLPEQYKQAVLLGEKAPSEATREAKAKALADAEAAMPSGKFRVIYADPPWSYGNTQPDYHTEQRDHYPVMVLADICAIPIRDMAMDNAVLFLWVTSPILEEAFQVINAWGFKYKASFVWDKVKHNMGHYNSVRHELLLVCTRGSCQPDERKLFDSVVTEERTEHSRKPDTFYTIIETLYTTGPYLELFARRGRERWHTYGNET